MQTPTSVAMLFVALTAIAVEAFVPVTVYNQCSESIELFDNYVVETVAAGGTTLRTLAEGFRGSFRNGVNGQASLAEFSVAGGLLFYGISIIPVGARVNPGCCASLEECKTVTGTTGYNTPMQITTLGCTSVTCLEDGCADAYHFPTDNTKTHACAETTSVVLTFCPAEWHPNDSEGLSQQQQQQQQQQYAQLPTTAATTPAPTQPSTLSSTPAQATEASPPVLTVKTPTQLSTEVPIPAIATSNSTLTETPSITPVTFADSNLQSGYGAQETATASPKKECDTGMATVSAPTAATTATTVPMAQVDDAPTPLELKTGMTTASVPTAATTASAGSTMSAATATPLPLVAYTPLTSTSSNSNGDKTQSANTQSSKDEGTGASTYVATGLGAMAVVAAVAVVVVAHKKKQELGEPEEKEYNQEDVMTPVTQINVL